jgi:hypothetical protein
MTSWAPPPGTSDERLAFLAVQPLLAGLSKPWYARLFRIIEAGAGSSVIGDRGMAKVPNGGLLMKRSITSELAGDQMASLVLACEQLSGRLTDDERQALRSSGTLPNYFLPELQREAKEIRQQWKRSG